MNRGPEVLRAAEQLISVDRREEYGDPMLSFDNIATIWSVILGIEVSPNDVALCMAGLKLARAVHNRQDSDSYIDLAGYVALAWEIAE